MTANARFKIKARFEEIGNHSFGGPTFYTDVLLNHDILNMDYVYVGKRTVASGANDDIDVSGVLTTPNGETVYLDEVTGIVIFNEAASLTNLTIGGSSNGLTGLKSAGVTIKPGGCFYVFRPDISVVAGTDDIIRVTNSADASNTYRIGVTTKTGEGGFYIDDNGFPFGFYVDDFGFRLNRYMDDLGRRL